MIARIVTTLVLATLLVPLAAAQNLEEPLVEHAEDKVAAASGDPAAFAKDHASEEAVADEAAWGAAYGCFALDYAHDEVGTPDPDLEQCEDYEEVLGIAPEPEEPVGVVQNLSEDPGAQVQEIADEAVAAVEEIADDPLSAPETLLGFLLYALLKIQDLIGGIGSTVADALDSALDLVGAALAADAKLGADVYDGTGKAASAITDGLVGVASSVDSGVGAVAKAAGGGIAAAAAKVGDGFGDAAKALGDAAESIGDAVGELVDRLLGADRQASPTDVLDGDDASLGDRTPGVFDVVDGLGRTVTRVV